MRAFFGILVLLNLSLFGWHAWRSSQQESAAPLRQVNEDKIVLLDAARLPPPQPALAARSDATKDERAAVPGAQCYEWGSFDAALAARAEELLTQRLPEIEHARRSVDGTVRYWIIIPPAPSDEATQTRINRLKQKGVTDFIVVRDDAELRNAISLGIYSSRNAAQRRMSELERQKVAGARVMERRSGGGTLQLLLRDVDPAVLPNVQALVTEFAQGELKAADCPVVAGPNDEPS